MDNPKLATVLHFPQPRRPIPEVDLYLPPVAAMKLGRIAEAHGMSPTALVNRWVHDGIRKGSP
jgi:hypothetical protein